LIDGKQGDQSNAAGDRERRDSQLTELAGLHLVIAQLVQSGIEVAVPVRDRGVDLIAYRDLSSEDDRFVACPIQLKVNVGQRFSLDKKYERIRNLIIAYVWNVEDPPNSSIYALTYNEALAVLDRKGHTKTASWRKGYYTIPKADGELLRLLEQYRMRPGQWGRKIASASGNISPEPVLR
jgi:hypothetical protein